MSKSWQSHPDYPHPDYLGAAIREMQSSEFGMAKYAVCLPMMGLGFIAGPFMKYLDPQKAPEKYKSHYADMDYVRWLAFGLVLCIATGLALTALGIMPIPAIGTIGYHAMSFVLGSSAIGVGLDAGKHSISMTTFNAFKAGYHQPSF